MIMYADSKNYLKKIEGRHNFSILSMRYVQQIRMDNFFKYRKLTTLFSTLICLKVLYFMYVLATRAATVVEGV